MPDNPELPALVPAEAVGVHAGVASRRGVIGLLADLLARGHGLDGEAVAASLHAREALGSTAFGGGIAIPHCAGPEGGGVQGAMLLLHTPVDWEAPDGEPVDLAVALVGPPGAAMLKALALVSRALRDPVLVAKLRGARSDHALWSLLAMQEAA